ncbi:MAG: hypothetical protein AABX02_04520, partial [archaeon]
AVPTAVSATELSSFDGAARITIEATEAAKAAGSGTTTPATTTTPPAAGSGSGGAGEPPKTTTSPAPEDGGSGDGKPTSDGASASETPVKRDVSFPRGSTIAEGTPLSAGTTLPAGTPIPKGTIYHGTVLKEDFILPKSETLTEPMVLKGEMTVPDDVLGKPVASAAETAAKPAEAAANAAKEAEAGKETVKKKPGLLRSVFKGLLCGGVGNVAGYYSYHAVLSDEVENKVELNAGSKYVVDPVSNQVVFEKGQTYAITVSPSSGKGDSKKISIDIVQPNVSINPTQWLDADCGGK